MNARNILLIDDDVHQHKLFECYAIRSNNNDVCFASDINEAIEQVKKNNLDLILLDNRFTPFPDFKYPSTLIRDAGYGGKLVIISSDIDAPMLEDFSEHSIDGIFNKSEFSLKNFDLLVESIFN